MNGQNRLVYLVRRMVLRFFSDGIPQAAAALSYFLLFSLLPLLMFVNALVARLGISIEDFRPVFELMPKSLQELILSYFEQITATPSFSPLLIGDAADAVFSVAGSAFDHAHGRRHLPRRGAPAARCSIFCCRSR